MAQFAKKSKTYFWKKCFECNYCKAISIKKINVSWVFFDAFLFQPLNKDIYIPILWFVTFYCLEMTP